MSTRVIINRAYSFAGGFNFFHFFLLKIQHFRSKLTMIQEYRLPGIQRSGTLQRNYFTLHDMRLKSLHTGLLLAKSIDGKTINITKEYYWKLAMEHGIRAR